MLNNVKAYRARFDALFAGFTSGQKTVLVLAVAGLMIAGLTFNRWAGTPSYVSLYSNLSSGDAAAVTQELTSKGVSYKLGDGGTAVLVPRKDLYQVRLDLSAKGLPGAGSAGYSLLDKQGITTSEFRQRVDYQRALEGELSNTIMAIEGVSAVTVHLVIPEDDLFAQDTKKPTASILVTMAGSRSLTTGQVQAVVHLTASGVEGLAPEDVTVADATGRVLSSPGQGGSADTDAQAQQTSSYQDRLARSLEDMLEPLVGAGHAVVRVSAAMNYDERTSQTETFGKENAPPVAANNVTENFTGLGNAVGGVLGPDTLPTDPSGESNTYSKTEDQQTFAIDKVTENVKKAPGTLERLSVAVLLDGKAKNATNRAEIERLVSAAAGLDANRGDTVEIGRMPFDTSAGKEEAKEGAARAAAEKQDQLMALVRNVGALLIVAMVLFLSYRSARKSSRAMVTTPIELPTGIPLRAISASPNPPRVSNGSQALDLGALTAGYEELEPEPAPEIRPAVQPQINELIEKQPDEVAQVLRSWLADRRS
ncbi:MAG: flagellar basal-body MS-ring/collar protein FliF [Acidimicrobiales bacterium]